LNEKAAERGAELHAALAALKEKYEVIGDVRGVGLMAGLEFVSDRDTKAPLDPKSMATIADVAYEAGVMIRVNGNLIILSPPLIVSSADVQKIAAGIEAGLVAASELRAPD